MNLNNLSNTDTKSEENLKKRILVIEDEKFWVGLLRIELGSVKPSIEIAHAKNGEEAVNLVRMSLNPTEEQRAGDKDPVKYDAIITDIQMPVMDGCTAVKIIRDLLYTGPIIVWSAYRDSAADLDRVLDIPVSGFCVKEGTLKNLLGHLRHLKVIE